MKSLLRQFVLVMIGLLVIAGSVSFMTGCRDKKGKEATEKSVEESYEESDDLWDKPIEKPFEETDEPTEESTEEIDETLDGSVEESEQPVGDLEEEPNE